MVGRLLNLLVLPIFIFSILFFGSTTVAISEEQRKAFESGVLYYDIDQGDSCSPNNTSSGAVSNNLYFMGDSLTVGANQTRLGEDSLQNQLVTAGWSPTINGQGCRPLYNATSPDGFEGDGSSCPLGTITSAFNEFDKDKASIAGAGTIVIALGTNKYEGSEDVFIQKGIEYVNMIKAENQNIGNRIYWVNTYLNGGGREDRANSISEIVTATGIQLVDYRSAAIADPTTHSFPSNDNTHNDDNGYKNKTEFIINAIGQATPQGSVGGYDPLSLTYPDFPDEAAIAAGIETTIASRYSQSPWIGKSQMIMEESKISNVNPLFIVASGGVESAFGNSKWGRLNNNYFGINQGRKNFVSPEEGIKYFIRIVPQYLDGTGSSGRYKDVNNIYEYSSVHQAGSIVYPGQDFDPKDIDSKPGVTKDLYDNVMDVWVSWTITDHPANKYDGQLFNPLVYYKINIQIINEVTGLSLPDTPTLGAASNISSCGGGPSANGVGANGWDLPGGANPMVYYSQRVAGNDSSVTEYYGENPYGTGTIAACGCGPTSFAMVVSTLTNNVVTPVDVAEWSVANGGQQPECGSYWWWEDQAALSETTWGVKSRQIDISEAEGVLRGGGLVITSVGPGSVLLSPGGNGHILVMRAVTNDGRFLFADPSDGPSKTEANPVLQPDGSSRTPLDSATVSTGLNALFAMERI